MTAKTAETGPLHAGPLRERAVILTSSESVRVASEEAAGAGLPPGRRGSVDEDQRRAEGDVRETDVPEGNEPPGGEMEGEMGNWASKKAARPWSHDFMESSREVHAAAEGRPWATALAGVISVAWRSMMASMAASERPVRRYVDQRSV